MMNLDYFDVLVSNIEPTVTHMLNSSFEKNKEFFNSNDSSIEFEEFPQYNFLKDNLICMGSIKHKSFTRDRGEYRHILIAEYVFLDDGNIVEIPSNTNDFHNLKSIGHIDLDVLEEYDYKWESYCDAICDNFIKIVSKHVGFPYTPE